MTLEGALAYKLHEDQSVPPDDCQSLRECLSSRLKDYFRDLEDHPTGDLHAMVMSEVEEPLLQIVVEHTNGNLSRAADILGIHRATLRRKLSQHGLI